jgi:uncharacterized membrane protein
MFIQEKRTVRSSQSNRATLFGSYFSNKFRFFIIVVLLIGIFFRFANIDKKTYWIDETDTSLRISGNTNQEVIQEVFDGRTISVTELLQNYQQINPDKSSTDTFKSLSEDVHPPLYFMLGRFWVQLFGDSVTSVTATRSFSVFLSLLVFPCLYWLCLELFESPLVGWMAILIASVSPLHVLYAQEARMYSLWTVSILISSAALLRARRINTTVSWLVYSSTIALSFYTFLFSVFVSFSHGVYCFISDRFRLSKNLFSYLIYSGLGLFSSLKLLGAKC